jgi:hypothetical protein
MVVLTEELDIVLSPYEMTEPGIPGAALFDRQRTNFHIICCIIYLEVFFLQIWR